MEMWTNIPDEGPLTTWLDFEEGMALTGADVFDSGRVQVLVIFNEKTFLGHGFKSVRDAQGHAASLLAICRSN